MEKCSGDYIPLVIAGDIFDIPCPDIALVNMFRRWADSLHRMLRVIPGQHDLKNHDIKSFTDTALGSLRGREILCPIESNDCGDGRIYSIYQPLVGGKEELLPTLGIEAGMVGAGWQQMSSEVAEYCLDATASVLAIHQYVHNGGATAFEGADKSQSAGRLCKLLPQYHFIFCGDNHTPFEYQKSAKSTLLVNCGALQCRNVKQRNFIPSVTVLCEVRKGAADSKLKVVRIDLDVSGIEWANENVLKLLQDFDTELMDFRVMAREIGGSYGAMSKLFPMVNAFLKLIKRPEARDDLLMLLDLDNDQ